MLGALEDESFLGPRGSVGQLARISTRDGAVNALLAWQIASQHCLNSSLLLERVRQAHELACRQTCLAPDTATLWQAGDINQCLFASEVSLCIWRDISIKQIIWPKRSL